MDELTFQTGFYGKSEEKIKKALCSLTDNREIDSLDYDMDASYFLQGCCDLFALALHRRFGYPVFIVGRKDGGFHEFCETIFEGKTVYIDVRGMTTDWNEFKRSAYWSFEDGQFFIEPAKVPDDLDNDVFDRLRFEFAERIIEGNMEAYSVKGK